MTSPFDKTRVTFTVEMLNALQAADFIWLLKDMERLGMTIVEFDYPQPVAA